MDLLVERVDDAFEVGDLLRLLVQVRVLQIRLTKDIQVICDTLWGGGRVLLDWIDGLLNPDCNPI